MAERVGIAGAFDTEAFNAGLNVYINGLLRAQSTTESVVNRINSLVSSIRPIPPITVDAKATPSTSGISSIVDEINKITNVQQDKVSSLIASITASLGKLGGAEIDSALTNLNDLGYSLSQLEKFSGNTKNLSKFFTDLSSALSTLTKGGDISTITSVLSTLSFALEGFANLRGIDPTQLTDALRQLEGVKPIPRETLDRLLQLVTTLDLLGKIPNVGSIGKALDTAGKAISNIGLAKLIDANTLNNLDKLGTTLQKLGSIGDISRAATDLTKVGSALKTFNKFPSIPEGSFDALLRLGDVVKVLSGAGDVSKIGSGLNSIVRSLKGLGAIQSVPIAAINSISAITRTLSQLGQLTGIDKATKGISSLVRNLSGLSQIKEIPGSVFSTLSGLVNVIRRLSEIPDPKNATSSIANILRSITRLGDVKPIPQTVIDSVVKFLAAISKSASASPAGLQNLANILQQLPAKLQAYSSAANTASTSTNSLFQSISHGIGVGIGVQAVSLFLNLKNAIGSLLQESYGLIQFFEGFSLSLETVIAAEKRIADSTLSFNEALAQSKALAFGYQKVLQELAIKSKFTTQQVSRGFQTAISQGFDADQALRITKALVDFTSGRGLSAEKLDLIALALGQVQSAAKLTGAETRQLSEAGVNVKQILSEAFKKPTSEIIAMMSDGLIPANAAIEAIVSSMERDFAGAAERTQNTLSGLISSLIDIGELSKAKLFETIFKPVIPILQELVALLNSDTFLATLQVIGELIGNQIAVGVTLLRTALSGLVQSFQALSPETKQTIATFAIIGVAVTALLVTFSTLAFAIGLLVNPFTVVTTAITVLVTGWVTGFGTIQNIVFSVGRNILSAFDNIATAAVDWGNNIISSLADGIIGGVNIILDALSVVGQAISYLLKPGSPPRLLPDLTTWGTGAAEAYLEGWTKVQFSALDEFGSLLEKRIRQGVELGQINEQDSFKFQLFGREQIAEAIEQIRRFGKVSTDTIKNIASVSGFSTDILDRYFAKYAAVTKATESVTEAQTQLNAITSKYASLIAPIQAQLDQFTREEDRASDADKLIKLNRIVANQTVSESRRQQALAEIKKITLENQLDDLKTQQSSETTAAQQRLDAAQLQLTRSQEQLDIYKSQLNVQLANVDVLVQQQQFFDKISAAIGDIGDKIKKGLEPLEKQLKIVQLQQEELNDLIELKRQQVILEDKNSTAAQKTAAELKIQEIQIRRNIRAAEAKELGVDLSSLALIPITMKDIGKEAKGAGDAITGFAQKFKGLDGVNLEGKLADFNKTIEDVRINIEGLGKSFSDTVDKINDKLPEFLSIKQAADGTTPAIEALKIALISYGAFIAGRQIIGSLPILAGIWRGLAFVAMRLIVPAIGAIVGVLGAPLAAVIAVAIAAMGGLYLAWTNNWFGIQEKVLPIIERTRDRLDKFVENNAFFKDTKTKVQETYNAVRGFFVDTDWSAVIQNVTKVLGGIWTGIQTAVTQGWQQFKVYWDGLGTDWLTRSIRLFGEVVGGIARFIIGTWYPMLFGAIRQVILFIVIDLPTELQRLTVEFLAFIVRAGFEFGTNVATYWIPAFTGWVATAIVDILVELFTFGTTIGAYIRDNLVPAIKDAGKSIYDGFVAGFTEAFGDVIPQSWKDAFNNLIGHVKSFWGIESPSTVAKDSFGLPIGQGVITGMVEAIINGVAEVLQAFQDLISGVFSAETLIFVVNKAKSIGTSIIDGIKEAFSDPGKTLSNAFTGMINSLFGAGEEEAEIKSPSQRAKRDIGEPIVAGIAEGLTLSSILQTVTGFIGSIITVFVGMATSVIASVVGLSTTLFASFTLMNLTLVSIVTAMSDLIDTDFTELSTTTQLTTLTMSINVVLAYTSLKSSVITIVNSLRDTIVAIFRQMADGAESAVETLKDKVLEQLRQLLVKVQSDFVEKGEEVGADFIRGMIRGIESEIEGVKKAAANAVNAAVDAAKEASESASPSKRAAREIGKPLTQGIEVGMESQLGNLLRSAKGITNRLFDSVNSSISSRLTPGSQSVINNSSTRVFNLNVNSSQSSKSIVRDFGIMQVMAAG